MLKSTQISYIKNNLETKVFLFFGIFFFLAFQSLSQFSLWVETEIYPVHSSQYLFNEYAKHFLFALKPFFYLILYLSSLFSHLFSLFPMTGARFLFALNGLLILALMYFYIKKKTDKYNAILAVLMLASASIFLDRGFRIRSDLLSSSLSLTILWLTSNINQNKGNTKFYILIPLLFSLLLISPKAIYWFFFTASLMFYDLKNKIPPFGLVVKTAFAVCIAFGCLSFVFKDPFFLKSISKSINFYMLNMNFTWKFILEKGLIKNLTDFSHISLFIERNMILILLISTKFVFIIHSVFIAKKRKWDFSDLYFCLLLFFLLFHPQQKLFFLCALMPFFIISFFTDWQWRQWLKHTYSPQFKTFLLAGVFIYSFSYITYINYKIYMKKNNLAQKSLTRQLNHFYKDIEPSVAIFDPTCIIYSRKTDCKYIPDDIKWDKKFKPYLRKHNFDIVLASRFLNLLLLIDYKQLFFQYINIKNHIYYKAYTIDLKNENHFLEIRDSKKTAYLSGRKSLKLLMLQLQTKAPEKSRKYSYSFLDQHNKIIKETNDCQKNKKTTLILESGCSYSEQDFSQGFIPIKEGKLALFYLPLPLDIPEELSLRALFRYDMF